MTSVTLLKEDLLHEFNYISNVGSKLFMFPLLSRSKFKLICYYIVYFLMVLTLIQLTVTLFMMGLNDWMEIINIAPNIGVCWMAIIKYTQIYKSKKLYNSIFYHFREDLWEFVPEYFTENVLIAGKYTNILKFLTKFVTYFTSILIVVVVSIPLTIMVYENKLLGKDLKLLYPFNAWYPFDKVKWYFLVYIWEGFMTAAVVSMYGLSDLIHLPYIDCICMELKLIGNSIRRLITSQDVENITQQKKVQETHDRIKRMLKFIIKRHAILEKFSSELDTVLGGSMILNYCFGSVFICLTAFSFTVVDDLYTSLRYFSFCLSLLLQMFNQCFMGQVLIDHSEAVAESIYSADWPYADQETKTILLMLLVRTQRPFKLTAKGYLTMDLNTFSGICKLSYQCFNLLRTIFRP